MFPPTHPSLIQPQPPNSVEYDSLQAEICPPFSTNLALIHTPSPRRHSRRRHLAFGLPPAEGRLSLLYSAGPDYTTATEIQRRFSTERWVGFRCLSLLAPCCLRESSARPCRACLDRNLNHLPRFARCLKHRINSVSRCTVVDGFPPGSPSSCLRFTDNEALSTAAE